MKDFINFIKICKKMGIAQAMNQNMKKNMQSQMQFQKQLIIRQRQTQLAMQISLGRERFRYFLFFYMTVVPLSIIGAIKKKNHLLFGPVVPLSFMLAFQYDMCYGTMMERARQEADKLIVQNPYKFFLPSHSGIVSQQQYEKIIGLKK